MKKFEFKELYRCVRVRGWHNAARSYLACVFVKHGSTTYEELRLLEMRMFVADKLEIKSILHSEGRNWYKDQELFPNTVFVESKGY